MAFTEPYGPADQIKYICEQSRKEINQTLFGEVTFSVKAGRIFKVQVNRSIKLDDKILNESREAMGDFKNHDYTRYKDKPAEREIIDEDGTKYPSVI